MTDIPLVEQVEREMCCGDKCEFPGDCLKAEGVNVALRILALVRAAQERPSERMKEASRTRHFQPYVTQEQWTAMQEQFWREAGL